MAGIKQPIQDILTKLATLQVINSSGQAMSLQPRIWNNQFVWEKDGKLYDFLKPAAFLEVLNNVEYAEIGQGFQSADVGWRVHIIHEMYDAQDGTFEQDLPVFDLRDQVVALLSLYEPTACGPLVRTGEGQDYEHGNLYHYIIDFICNFTDSKGSPWDPAAGKYISSTPPTGIEINAEYVESLPPSPGAAPENAQTTF
jgi:hypothetical protein